MSFESHIKGKNTSLYPVVTIDGIHYSTRNTMFNGAFCKPLILSNPVIKEDVDIDSRLFKVSNINLRMSNINLNGVRFTDQLSENSLINSQVSINFVSPSGSSEVYSSTIRRITHDNEIVNISLEDVTQIITHRDIPIASVPNDNTVVERYKGKPIPMVYGEVDKSPVVVAGVNYLGDYVFKIDENPVKGLYTSVEPLADRYDTTGFFLYNNIYANISKNDFEYIEESNEVTFPKKPIVEGHDKGKIGINYIVKPDSIQANSIEPTDILDIGVGNISPEVGFNGDYNILNILDDNPDTYTSFKSDRFIEKQFNSNVPTNFIDANINFGFNNHFGGTPIENKTYDDDGNEESSVPAITSGFLLKAVLWDLKNHTLGGIRLNIHSAKQEIGQSVSGMALSNSLWDYYYINNINENNTIYPEPEDLIPFDILHPNSQQSDYILEYNIGTGTDRVQEHSGIKLQSAELAITHQYGYSTDGVDAELRLFSFLMRCEGQFEQDFSNEFYVSTQGRTAGSQVITHPMDIISHIVTVELNGEVDTSDFIHAKSNHTLADGSSWMFAFTQKDRINSKKLIADICRSTKCFPRFGSDGKFKFNSLQDTYTLLELEDRAVLINSRDIISGNFKKTSPENIHRKVKVDYKVDYATGKFSKTTAGIDLPEEFYGSADTENTALNFSTNYIREENTANALEKFLSEYYKNDHLILDLKLPVEFLQLEIGDLVRFEGLLGDCKAYGIDYSWGAETQTINGQVRYPAFMVYAVSKEVDKVGVKCIQLHKLGESQLDDDDDDGGGEVEIPPTINTYNSNGGLASSEEFPQGQDYTTAEIPLPIATAIDSDGTDISDNIVITFYTSASELEWTEEQLQYLAELNLAWDENGIVTSDNTGALTFFPVPSETILTYTVTSPTTGLTVSTLFTMYIGGIDTVAPSIYIQTNAISSTAFANSLNAPFPGNIPNHPAFGFNYYTHDSPQFTHVIERIEGDSVSYWDRYCTDAYGTQQVYVSFEDLDDDVTLYYGLDAWQWGIDNGIEGFNYDMFIVEKFMFDGNPNVSEELTETSFNTQWTYDADTGFVNNKYYVVAVDSSGNYKLYWWEVYCHMPREVVVENPNAGTGDVNGDGGLNILDVIQIVNYTLGNLEFSDEQIEAADINSDTIINILDIVQTVNMILD